MANLLRAVTVDGRTGVYYPGIRKPVFFFDGGYAVVQPVWIQATDELAARVLVYSAGKAEPEVLTWKEFRAFTRECPVSTSPLKSDQRFRPL